MNNKDCFICKKHAGEITNTVPLYEYGLFFVNHLIPNENEVYLGYLFIETKKHIPTLDQLSDEEATGLGILLRNIGKIFITSFDADHVYSFILGDHVPHFHMHVVPRYRGTPKEYWGINIDKWPDAPRGNFDEVNSFCGSFRRLLAGLTG
ncbi:MAG: HIT family protein [Spirochaetales bacterium]|nr:HIT family protein [Spirochaetales bacterium]